jgi:hypothetical protein
LPTPTTLSGIYTVQLILSFKMRDDMRYRKLHQIGLILIDAICNFLSRAIKFVLYDIGRDRFHCSCKQAFNRNTMQLTTTYWSKLWLSVLPEFSWLTFVCKLDLGRINHGM